MSMGEEGLAVSYCDDEGYLLSNPLLPHFLYAFLAKISGIGRVFCCPDATESITRSRTRRLPLIEEARLFIADLL